MSEITNNEFEDKLIEVSLKNKQLTNKINDLKTANNLLLNKLVHNLKNPIGASFSFSEMLIDNLNNFDVAKIQKYLGVIKSSSNHAIEILNAIAKLNTVKSSDFTLQLSIENYSSFIFDIIDLLKVKYPENQFKVNIPSDILLQFDKNEMKYIINELVNNAVRFSELNSTITIEIQEKGDFVTTTITDNGIGFTSPISNHIYNEFYVENTYDVHKHKCLGLGLTIVNKLIEKHNGNIQFSTKKPKGTLVTLTLAK